MQKAKKNLSKEQTITVSIIVVAILLLASLCLLLFLPKNSGSSSLTGNVIGKPENVITLKNKDSEGELRFNIQNMFPGDSVSKTFTVKITDDKVEAVSFFADFGSGGVSSDALKIRVRVDEAETALYDGAVAQMPARLRAEVKDGVSEIKFDISVYLDTSVGNEYQKSTLSLAFHWWVDDGDYVTNRVEPEPTEKCSPWCFGICPWCWIIVLILAIALVITVGIGIAWMTFCIRKTKAAMAEGRSLTAMEVGLGALFTAIGMSAGILINKALNREDDDEKRENKGGD